MATKSPIFLLDVNFDKSNIILNFLIISFIFAKFQKDKKINKYIINRMFKFQVFVIFNYAYKINL